MPATTGPQQSAKKAPPPPAVPAGEPRHLAGTVLKRTAAGEVVMSDHLDAGDTVAGQDDAN